MSLFSSTAKLFNVETLRVVVERTEFTRLQEVIGGYAWLHCSRTDDELFGVGTHGIRIVVKIADHAIHLKCMLHYPK